MQTYLCKPKEKIHQYNIKYGCKILSFFTSFDCHPLFVTLNTFSIDDWSCRDIMPVNNCSFKNIKTIGMEKEKIEELKKINYQLKKLVPRNPREAAMLSLLPHIINESWYTLHIIKDIKMKTNDYSALIHNRKITITEFYDVPLHIEFDVGEILKELVNIYFLSKP